MYLIAYPKKYGRKDSVNEKTAKLRSPTVA